MSAVNQLVAGTRGSRLALWQTHHVAGRLSASEPSLQIDVQEIKTRGDRITDVPLWQVDGKAFFTKELDDALLDGRIDFAVHSLKDLATQLPAGIAVAAVLPREDPRDALVARAEVSNLDDLPAGSRVGTSSLRRRAFLAARRPDIELCELRGNVPTRLQKVLDGELDAVVLAAAGLKRLQLHEHISVRLPLAEFPPAPGQGAIAVCVRSDDERAHRHLAGLDDFETRVAVEAERTVLARLEGGCHTPLGAYARIQDGRMTLHAMLADRAGSRTTIASDDDEPERPTELGNRVAESLLRDFGPIENEAQSLQKAGT